MDLHPLRSNQVIGVWVEALSSLSVALVPVPQPMDTREDADQVPVLSAFGGQSKVHWLPGPCSVSTGLQSNELSLESPAALAGAGETAFLSGKG